jgi:hypothetical protein
MNRALGVPQTHVRYTGPETNRALELWIWTWDEQGIGSNSDTWELHNRTWDEQ